MGYYTSFSLTWETRKPQDHESVGLIVAGFIRENEEASYALNEDGSTNEDSKWYEAKADLKNLSLSVRHTLFILECLGEDGTRWRIYAKDGLCEKVEPTLVWKVPKFAAP